MLCFAILSAVQLGVRDLEDRTQGLGPWRILLGNAEAWEQGSSPLNLSVNGYLILYKTQKENPSWPSVYKKAWHITFGIFHMAS